MSASWVPILPSFGTRLGAGRGDPSQAVLLWMGSSVKLCPFLATWPSLCHTNEPVLGWGQRVQSLWSSARQEVPG